MSTRSLGQLTLDLVARTGNFERPMDRASKQAERQFKQMERDGKAAAKSLGLITAAATAAAGAIYAYGKAGMNTIDANAKLARSLDGTLDGLRALKMAAEDNGLDGMEASLNRMNRRLGAVEMNGGPAAKTVERLGLNLKAMQDMDIDERLAYIADQIKATGMSSQEAARHLQQLGFEQRGAYELFMRGGDVIRAAREEMEAYGLSISEIDAAAIEDANTAISKLSLVSESAQNALAIRLAPALHDIADAINDITKAFHAGEYDDQIRIMGHVATAAAGAAAGYTAYRVAVAAATVAQWAFNVAVRANPIGAAVTAIGAAVTVIGAAAGALYSMRDEASKATIDVAGLTTAFRDLTAAQQENRRMEMAGNLAEMRIEAGKLGSELAKVSELVRNSGQLTEHGGALPIASAEDIARGRELRAELAQLLTDIDAGSEVLAEYDAIMARTGASTAIVTDNSREQTKELVKLESSYQSLIDRLYPLEASQRRFREEMELLDLAAQAGEIDDLADAQRRLLESAGDWQDTYNFEGMGGGGEEGSYWERWLESAELALTDFDQLAANTAENFQRGFGNAFESMVFDSQSLGDAMYNLTEGIARSMVSALGEMAAQWLAYQAVQMMVGRTTQSSAASTMITNAMAQQQMAGLNAFSSIAAIPIVGPFMAPGAMAAAIAATSPSVSAISSLAVAGMAHDGIDSIPREGTWLLDKGERVLNAPQANKLDRFLDQQQAQDRRRDGGVTVNIIENPERAGQRETTVNANGREEESLFVADIYGDGPRSRAIQNAFGLQRRGR